MQEYSEGNGRKTSENVWEAEASLSLIAVSNVKYSPTYQINIVNSYGVRERVRDLLQKLDHEVLGRKLHVETQVSMWYNWVRAWRPETQKYERGGQEKTDVLPQTKRPALPFFYLFVLFRPWKEWIIPTLIGKKVLYSACWFKYESLPGTLSQIYPEIMFCQLSGHLYEPCTLMVR